MSVCVTVCVYTHTYTSSPWVVTLSWQHMTYKPRELGQTNLVLGSPGLFMQDYKSIHTGTGTVISTEQFFRALKTHLFTLD